LPVPKTPGTSYIFCKIKGLILLGRFSSSGPQRSCSRTFRNANVRNSGGIDDDADGRAVGELVTYVLLTSETLGHRSDEVF
jgi:hypothetical protein